MAHRPFTWQRLPLAGGQLRSDNTVANAADGVDRFGQQETVEYTPIVEIKPLPTISPLRNATVPEDGTGVSIVDGEIELDGTTLKRALYTREYGRYLPGLIALAGAGYNIVDYTVGHYEIGYGNGQGERVGLEIDNGTFYTFVEKNGNRYYRQPRSQWMDPLDGTGPSKAVVTDEELSRGILRLYIGWYGYLSIEYRLAVPNREKGDRVYIVDRNEPPVSGVTLTQPDLPMFAEADGGVMYIGGRQFGVFGRYRPSFRPATTPSVAKSVGTTFEHLVSVTPKSTEAKWLSVPIYFDNVSIVTDVNTEYAAYIIPSDDITGATPQDLDDVNGADYAIQYDTAGTIDTLVNSYKLTSDYVTSGRGGAQSAGEANPAAQVRIPVGFTLALVVRGLGGNASVNGTLTAAEEH